MKKSRVINEFQQNIRAFSLFDSSAYAEKNKQHFEQQLDLAVCDYIEFTKMLSEGNKFYIQLSNYMSNLNQNISDFKVSRELEKEDLIQNLS